MPGNGLMWLQGESGTGKTSVLEIILGFRQKENGTINFKKQKPDQKTRCFYFTQNTEIFHKDLIFNIILSNLDLVKFIFNQRSFN